MTMSYPEEPHEDDREIFDVPPSEPAGHAPVKFNVPIPTVEQIIGEVARQLIQLEGYRTKTDIFKAAQAAIIDKINETVAEKVGQVIEEILTKPMQPTDGFGNPIGEPTSLQGFIAAKVKHWSAELVDREGRPTKHDHYNSNSVAPRINWELGKIVNGELKKQVDAEVSKIVATLRDSATQIIAKQIADKVAGLVLKPQ